MRRECSNCRSFKYDWRDDIYYCGASGKYRVPTYLDDVCLKWNGPGIDRERNSASQRTEKKQYMAYPDREERKRSF